VSGSKLPSRRELCRVEPVERKPGVLEELLVIDGVTDLAVYRLLTGGGRDLVDVLPPPRPRPHQPGEQLALLMLIQGEAE
jgi:hypothetical protein